MKKIIAFPSGVCSALLAVKHTVTQGIKAAASNEVELAAAGLKGRETDARTTLICTTVVQCNLEHSQQFCMLHLKIKEVWRGSREGHQN